MNTTITNIIAHFKSITNRGSQKLITNSRTLDKLKRRSIQFNSKIINSQFVNQDKKPLTVNYFDGVGDSEILNNILIVEYDAKTPGSPRNGGPVWPNSESQQKYGHWRNRKIHTWSPKKKVSPTAQLSKGLWLGPISPVFGHQVAEFSSKFILCAHKFSQFDLLFSVSAGSPISSIDGTPHYFRQILKWFGIHESRVIIIREPTMVEQLIVIRQQESLKGPGPSFEYLDLLTKWATGRFYNIQATTAKLLYVSRVKTRIPLAGEEYLERVFDKLGYQVYHPQDHALEEQLLAYNSADQIIFASGSSVHLLQLLGKIKARVLILNRNPHYNIGEYSISRRCEKSSHIEIVKTLLFCLSKRNAALPIIDSHLIRDFLITYHREKNFDWDETEFQKTIDKDITNWLKKYRRYIKKNPEVAINLKKQLTTIGKKHLIPQE